MLILSLGTSSTKPTLTITREDLSVNDNVWCTKHLTGVHSWNEQRGRIKTRSPSRKQSRKRKSTHLWKASRMSRSSAGDSSITIASVLSPAMVQASILLFLLLLFLELQGEGGTTSFLIALFFSNLPTELYAAAQAEDAVIWRVSCSALGSAAADRCWGCGRLRCPELRADWRGRSDAEDLANRMSVSSGRLVCRLPPWLFGAGATAALMWNTRMVRSRKPTLSPHWAIWSRWQC